MKTTTESFESFANPMLSGPPTPSPGVKTAFTRQLDTAHAYILSGDVFREIELLINGIRELRLSVSERAWRELVSLCRRHPLCAALHQDPLTWRCFTKPRGYAGDAVMLDMIYRIACKNDSSELGKSICNALVEHSNAAMAVRHRRSLIARVVNEVCSGGRAARLLSIASGHLREAELTKAKPAKGCGIREWVCIDQDVDSLLECVRSYGDEVIKVVPGSVRQILSGKVPLGEFDFVYAAGLFDYLSTPVAGALLCKMFEMLNPGGKFLITNFTNTCRETGYMEAFMDWWLLHRDEEQMNNLVEVLDHSLISSIQVFTDPWETIVYATGERSR